MCLRTIECLQKHVHEPACVIVALLDFYQCSSKLNALSVVYSSFSQTHTTGDIGIIANFVFPYIGIFLLYLNCIILIM